MKYKPEAALTRGQETSIVAYKKAQLCIGSFCAAIIAVPSIIIKIDQYSLDIIPRFTGILVFLGYRLPADDSTMIRNMR